MAESHSVISSTIVPTTPGFSSSSTLQVSELESDHPLFRVGDAVYRGEWRDMVGTELYALQGTYDRNI